MRDGFLKVMVTTPDIRVADCDFNTENIIRAVREAEGSGAKLLVLPELCITGYTCGDLFLQNVLTEGALDGLYHVREATRGMDVAVVFTLPFLKDNKLYNVAAVVQDGRVLGLVPKTHLPNYSEFYEARHFVPGDGRIEHICLFGEEVSFGTKLLFACRNLKNFVFGVEICEDLWVANPPSGALACAGALLIANPSASDETTGKAEYRRQLVSSQSARTVTAYLYADAGEGESTTDLVFAAHNLIAENGTILSEGVRFENGGITAQIDLKRLAGERRRMTTYRVDNTGFETIYFALPSLRDVPDNCLPELSLTRFIDKAPFVPSDEKARAARCQEIICIQAMGLKKRLVHTGMSHVVLGISGGLDSTLALLVTCRAFELTGLDKKGILAVTMPCFGTTGRTYTNACALVEELGVTLSEVKIEEAVRGHLRDIGHPDGLCDVTYENAQARERTQILMDMANQHNALVIGTGDMSELALGWATYNGDHISMYGVNASVPKTLVRYLVGYFADTAEGEGLTRVLNDILDTPVSPELLPPKDGEIAQKTEDIVGPYELHDFFLYYVMRFGFEPRKIYRLAVHAFAGEYDPAIILKWLRTFYRRFFAQQFKRSCLPDGPKVGSVAVSPRGDLRMPSDACVALWMKQLEEGLEEETG
ncbi:MAG: NAD(+) synthase [Lachnospiraceae bacterium]|nr:NAD(+) synthase [Lachnospiraceae bacterium]